MCGFGVRFQNNISTIYKLRGPKDSSENTLIRSANFLEANKKLKGKIGSWSHAIQTATWKIWTKPLD